MVTKGQSVSAKGKRFERQIVESIRKEFGLTKFQCYRTPVSGGHPYTAKSDVIFYPEELWKEIGLFIECKFRSSKECDLNPLIEAILLRDDKRKWKPFKWLEEAKKKCPDHLVPVVVIKGVRREPLAVFDVRDVLKQSDKRKQILDNMWEHIVFGNYEVWLFKKFLEAWKETLNFDKNKKEEQNGK